MKSFSQSHYKERFFSAVLLLYFVTGAVLLRADDGLFIVDTVNLNLTTNGQTSFQSVTFADTFDVAPVVVLTPNANNPDPAGLRIRNVTTSGFEISMVEPIGSNGEGPAMGAVSFFAAEVGRYTFGGVDVEVGSLSTVETVSSSGGVGGFQDVSFVSELNNSPAVFGMVQTMFNEAGSPPGDPSDPWLTVKVDNVSTTEMQIGFERSETGSGNLSSAETLGYMVVDTGFGSFLDDSSNTIFYDSFVTSDSITGDLIPVSYNQTNFTTAPLVNANIRSRDGGDGGWAQIGANSSTQVELTVEEDVANDTDRTHTDETFSVLAFSEAFVATIVRKSILEWSGGGLDDNGSTGANWNNWDGTNAELDAGDIILFDDTGSVRLNPNIDTNYTISLDGIRFAEGTAYNVGGTGGFVLSGATGLVNDSTETQNWDVDLTASGSRLGLDAVGGDLNLTSGADIDLSVGGGATLEVDGTNDVSIAGIISGTGADLSHQGRGELTLSGNNTYTGITEITGDGTLRVGDGGTSGTLGTGAVSGTGNSTLIIDRNDTYTYGNTIDVPNLEIASGTLSASNDITASSSYTMASGTKLDVTSDLTLDISGAGSSNINVSNDAAIEVAAGQNLTINVSEGLPAFTSETVYHSFDDASDPIGTDDSGNSFNSTNALGSLPSYDSTNVIEGASSAFFDGTEGLSFANGNGLISNDAESILSLGTWIRPTDTSGTNVIFEEGGGTNGVQLWLDGTTLRAGIHNNNEDPVVFFAIPGAVTEDEWSHVAFTYDNGAVRLYLDGALVGDGTFDSALNAHGSDGGIGNSNGAPFQDGTFTGNIDEFYYFNDLALSGGQIDGFGDFGPAKMGDLILNSGSTATVNNTGTEVGFDSVTANGDSNLNGTTTLQVSNVEVAGGATLDIDNDLSGADDFNKTGAGAVALNGTSDFTGSINISGGQVIAGGPLYNNVSAGEIVISSGGTLLLDDVSVFDTVTSAADVTLDGGTFALGSGADGGAFSLGTLTLSSDSTIDFGTLGSGGSINFADSSAVMWDATATLTVINWDGTTFTGGGLDQLFFGSNAGGLTAQQRSQIVFADHPYQVLHLSDGEVVPVPEPGVFVSASALLVLVGAHAWGRRRRCQIRVACD